ncbi:hypothetical protein GCM10020331_094360 [Ectobacillus funiculus]
MAEAVMVATALKAGSALAHGVNALNAYDKKMKMMNCIEQLILID